MHGIVRVMLKARERGSVKNRFGMFAVALICSLLIMSCSDEIGGEGELDEIGTATQKLDATRTRVIRECSQAMWGSWWTYNETNWPTGTTYASYAYTSADIGAWNLLLANTGGYGYSGFYTSCMRYRSEGHLPYPYTACQLSESTGAGSYEMPYYTCQGYCPSAYKRGGQCKPFMNLVAYRSGTYQNPGYAWKSFPVDSAINGWDTSADQMPYATYTNILPGDYLRRPYGHALIIVRKINSSRVVVLDSNWSGGDGAEIVSSHEMGFTGGGGNSDLGAYRVLKCAYTGGC